MITTVLGNRPIDNNEIYSISRNFHAIRDNAGEPWGIFYLTPKPGLLSSRNWVGSVTGIAFAVTGVYLPPDFNEWVELVFLVAGCVEHNKADELKRLQAVARNESTPPEQ